MKTLNEICTEYQNIVYDLEEALTGGNFRRHREPGKPKIILERPSHSAAIERPHQVKTQTGEGQSLAVPPASAERASGSRRAFTGGSFLSAAANPAAALEALAEEVRGCSLCPLCEKRKQAVPGVGVINPLVMVIGEAPGAEEDQKGEPFVGPAGRYLDKWLEAVGLSRHVNAYIANIVKCRPPENRDPAPEEAAACMPYLLRQTQIIRPKTVLAAGRVAAQNLLQTGEGIGRLRGQSGTWQGLPFLATYHPSAVLRDPQLRRPVWDDMKKLKGLIDAQDAGQADAGAAPDF